MSVQKRNVRCGSGSGLLIYHYCKLLSKEGVALLPFALHSNASDDDVWGVIERAKCVGFEVEILSPEQLNPTDLGMDEKRSLVQTIRLTKEL